MVKRIPKNGDKPLRAKPHYARVRQQEMLKVVIGEILENEDKSLKESGEGLSRN